MSIDINTPKTFAQMLDNARENKTNILTVFSVFASQEQSARFKSLIKINKSVPFFECEGSYYKGSLDLCVIKFILDNPNLADFSVWCQNNLTTYLPLEQQTKQ